MWIITLLKLITMVKNRNFPQNTRCGEPWNKKKWRRQHFLLSLVSPESIEGFIENQAFLLSFDLAPPPPASPLPVSKLSLFISLPVCRRSSLLTGEGVGEEEPNHTTARKPDFLKIIPYSLVSAIQRPPPPPPNTPMLREYRSQSSNRGRVEKERAYLPSELERTLQLCMWW